MLESTYAIIKTGLKTDPTVTPASRASLLKILRDGPNATKTEPATITEPRLIRRAEVARRLSRSLRFVDKLAAGGVLAKHKLPGRVRASGFLASDVDTLIVAGIQCGGVK